MTNSLSKLVDAFSKEGVCDEHAYSHSVHYYAKETMNIAFEFFDSMTSVPPLFTSQTVQEVGFGHSTPVRTLSIIHV